MNKKMDNLLFQGFEILFGYVAEGKYREFLKCEITDIDYFSEGFGHTAEEAFQNAYKNLSETVNNDVAGGGWGI